MSPPQLDRGASAMGAGMTWAVSVALFVWLGTLLDGRLGTTPLFTVVGALLGALGGFLHFVSRVAPDMLPFGKGKARPKADPPPDRPPKSE